MSDVKMCDRCGNIFSVSTEGWSHLTQSVEKVNEHKVKYTETLSLDVCAECSIAPTTEVRPVIQLEGGKGNG